MANRKKASRKNKTLLEKETYTAELSSRQLVIGVCILIAFGLACFMLGVIVGRFDPVDPQPTAESERTRTFKVSSSDPEAATPKDSNREPKTLARKPARNTPLASADSTNQTGTTSNAAQGRTTIPTRPRAQKPSTAKPARKDPPSTPVNSGKTTAKPSPDTAPKEVTEVARVEKPSAPPKEASSAGDAAKELWTVQVGVYSIRKNAVRIKAQIDAKSSFKAELLDTPDGKNVTVIVGKYGSLAEAVKVRDELSKKLGYGDSFPKKRKPE